MIFKYARDYIAALMSVRPSVRPSEITLNPEKKKVLFFHKKSEKIFFLNFGSRSLLLELEPLENFIN